MSDANLPGLLTEFAVFLSHNSLDKPAVRFLKERLTERGITCWFDATDLRGGTDWLPRLEEGLRMSRCCAIFYGPLGIGPWHEMERQLAQLMAAEAGREGRHFGIIPVRLPDAPDWRKLSLPPFLRLYASVEFPSLSDDAALDRLIAGILQQAPAPEKSDPAQPPFIGMRPFSENESSIFTGRNDYIVHVTEYLHRAAVPRFLAVLGASGSGKSSLLHAGVLSRLRKGTLRPETKDWVYVTMRPGGNAWSNLRAAIAGHPLLLPYIGTTPTTPKRWLHEVATAALGTQNGAPRLILIVDQFEELLTARPQGESETDRKRNEDYMATIWQPFVQNLAEAAEDPAGPVSVIIAMRSDFLKSLAADPDLDRLLEKVEQRCLVKPLSEAEVRSAIEGPAIQRGLKFDAALVETVTQDYFLDPGGALPFLQEALRRVWELGDRKRLSLADYREFGGLPGAVNAHAEAVLERITTTSPEKVPLFLPIFIHLTRLDEDGSDTKRRRPLVELPGGESAQELARELSKQENRLLVLDDAPGASASGQQPMATVEIAHESLLAGWEQLKSELNDQKKRPSRVRLRRIEATARLWQQETGEARPAVLRGAELRQAERLSKELSEEVTEVTRDYVKASRKAANIRTARNGLMGVVGLVALALVWIYARPGPVDPNAEILKKKRRELASLIAQPKFDAVSAGVLSGEILELAREDARSEEFAIRARALLEQGQFPAFDSVIASWEKKVQPRAAQIEDLLGDKEAKQGRRKEAIKHWSAYVEQRSLDLAARKVGWKKLTAALGAEGRWTEARDRFSDWIKADRNDPEPRLGLIAAYEQLGKWEERDKEIDWLKRNQPDAIEATGLVEMSSRKKIEDWDSAVAKDPRDTKARLGRAVALTRERQFKRALDDIQAARQEDPDSPRLKIEEAHLHWQLDQPIPDELGVSVEPQWTRDRKEFPRVYDAMQRNLPELKPAEPEPSPESETKPTTPIPP
ncbi:MAG: hypothetical protein QOC70_2518 [Verrucomicrobiota bacterium]|jgi:tetratricopeptide (TPR) repeat protein